MSNLRLHAALALLCISLGCDARTSSENDALRSVADFGRDSTGMATASLVNRRWLAERFDMEATSWIRIAETDSARWCGGEIDWCHTVSLVAWRGAPDSLGAPAWRVTVAGNPGGFDRKYRPSFYRVEHPGCCDAQSATSYVNLRTGVVAFQSTRSLLRLHGDREQIERRVGLLDTWSALSPAEARTGSGFGGVLQYGAPDGPVQRVGIVGDTALAPLRTCCRLDSMALRVGPRGAAQGVLYLDRPAEQLANGVWIWIRLMPDYEAGFVELLIPIRGDSLDISRALLPRGIRLVALPAAT